MIFWPQYPCITYPFDYFSNNMKSYYRYLLLPLLCVSDALADYGDNANQAINQLQQSYNTGTGLWYAPYPNIQNS